MRLLLLLELLQIAATLRVGLRPRSLVVMKLPDEVANLVPEAVRDLQETEANWQAIMTCYPTEADAITAVKINTALVVPYGFDAANRASNIRGSYKALQELLSDDAEVLEIITKNPGVLGCTPKELAASSVDQVRMAADVAAGFDNVLGPAKRFLSSLDWWDEKTKSKLAGGSTATVGFAPSEEEDVEDLELEEIEFDGETFLFDAAGAYNGEKNLLLAQRGEEWVADLAKSRPVWVPYGTWDPETEMLEEYVLDDVE